MSDDPALARQFVKSGGGGDVFDDLAVLLGASGVVMHSPGGWSAFSAMAPFFRGIPTLTTAHDLWQLSTFRRAGAKLDGWYTCDTMAAFLVATGVQPRVTL